MFCEPDLRVLASTVCRRIASVQETLLEGQHRGYGWVVCLDRTFSYHPPRLLTLVTCPR
jgi:hypothetical protein